MAMFMYCEQAEGGMETWTFSQDEDLGKLIPGWLQ